MPRHLSSTGSGTRAHIRIDGVLYRKHFKTGTSPHVIKAWLLKTELRYRGRKATASGRFDDDARVYLASVAAMPTIDQRRQHIHEWVDVFGSQWRHTITASQIATALHRWRMEPRDVTQRAKPGQTRSKRLTLSAAAVNKRRTALMHLFTVLDGKAAPNVVKDVPKFREPDALPKGLPYKGAIDELWAQMADTKTRARLQVMAYVGLPQAQIASLRPEHINRTALTVTVHGRKKGRGTVASVRPLSRKGLRALDAMARLDAWGSFSRPTLRRYFRAACLKVPALAPLASSVSPYDLRHSFVTEVWRVSKDARATQLLAGHAHPSTTHGYMVAAELDRMTGALKGFGRGR